MIFGGFLFSGCLPFVLSLLPPICFVSFSALGIRLKVLCLMHFGLCLGKTWPLWTFYDFDFFDILSDAYSCLFLLFVLWNILICHFLWHIFWDLYSDIFLSAILTYYLSFMPTLPPAQLWDDTRDERGRHMETEGRRGRGGVATSKSQARRLLCLCASDRVGSMSAPFAGHGWVCWECFPQQVLQPDLLTDKLWHFCTLHL